ncbi:hypothetical protein RB595_007287 [Gaeumannomyces hyphopodioides]
MENRSVEVLAVAIAFFVLCWVAVLLRVYCRALVLRSLGADDFLMIVSLAVFTGYLICILLALKFGAGKHRDDVDPGDYTTALKLIYASQLLYVATVCLVKISVGFFLLRISVKTPHVVAIRALMAVTLLYGTAYLFLLAFQCVPASTFWDEGPRAAGRCLGQGLLLGLTYAASAVNAAADWAFGVLPFFIVWSLSLPLRTRALAVGILSLAAVGSAATIVRAVYIPRLVAADDFLWSTADVAVWSTVEPGVGIIAASIATLRPLWEIICGRSGLPSNDAPRSPGGGGVMGPRSWRGDQRVASADDDDDDGEYPPYYQQGGRHQHQHHSQLQHRVGHSVEMPRSHFSSPSSPEERGADAGLWGGRHSRPRVPMLTLSWLFSPLGSRIANGGGGGGGDRSSMGTHGGSGWRPRGGGKARFGLDDGDGVDEGNWRLTGMTALAGPARDRHATPPPPLPPLPALMRQPILQHQAAAAVGPHHGFHPDEAVDDDGHKNAFISSYSGHDHDISNGHVGPQPPPPTGRTTVGSFPTRPDTMATMGTTDSQPAPQLLDVQAARHPVPFGHAYRHEGARTRSYAGEIDNVERRSRVISSLLTPSLVSEPGTRPESFVIPPHWKRDTLHNSTAVSGVLQPVESNEQEQEQEQEQEHEHEHEQQQYGYEQHHQQQQQPPQYGHEEQRQPSSDGGQGGTWMLESQPSQPQSLQPWTTESSSVWGAQTAQLQHQLPLPHPQTQAQYGTAADEDCVDGRSNSDMPSESSEAPRLDWSTPRVSAISFGVWGGGPRSEGAHSRSSVAVADARGVPALRSKSNASQRSGRSGGGASDGGGVRRSGSLGNFRPRRMADYAAPVPNLPLRYLRQTRRERSAAAAEQGGEGDGYHAQHLAAAEGGQAMPQPPLAEVGGVTQGWDRRASGTGGSDASGSSMASRIPARKKKAMGMAHNYI